MNVKWLTKRELEAWKLVGAGLREKQIAEKLGIEPTSVANLKTAIARKLGIRNSRVQLGIAWLRYQQDDECVCGYVLHFTDGGGTEERILFRGSRGQLEEIGRLLPSYVYDGERPLKRAEFVIKEKP